MKQYTGIVSIGVVAIIVIVIANMTGLPLHISRGLTLIGISVIFLLASAALFTFNVIVGIVGLLVTVIYFMMGWFSFQFYFGPWLMG